MTATVMLDGGWTTTREAEHALHDAVARLGLRPLTACTQFLTDPGRVAVTVELESPAPAELSALIAPADLAAAAVTAHQDGSAGRAFIFPGSEQLLGVLRVGDLMARTTIDDVLLMGGVPVNRDSDLDTQGFVRPVFRGGRLVLLTRPGIGGVVVPFEQPNPTPCCADHP
jgi:hypothetical protein